MINKKIAVLFTVLFLFHAFIYAEGKNFVTIASGGGTQNFNTTTLGQAIVFAQKTDRYIAKSGYASILMTTKSDDITFVDETEKKTFETNVVPIKVKIETAKGQIDQIVYKVGNGENPNFDKIPAVEYSFTKGTTVTFEKNIDFTEGQSTNQFWLWAQYKDGDAFDSSYIIITVNTEGTVTKEVKLESPDPLTGLASTDPVIKTSQFSVDLADVTISLYEGTSVSGTLLYEVSTSNPEQKAIIFNETDSCISYLNSDILGAKLQPNKEYELKFIFSNEIYEDFTAKFKVLKGGVANILTYPSPFNPNKGEKIKIRYTLAKKSKVTIRLYDKAGKIVCKLLDNADKSAGTNEDEWNGRNYAGDTLATGAYICEIIAKASDGEHRRYTALAIVGK